MKTIRLARRVAALLLLALALPAGATFHLWRMTELYSSADGKVQFLELATTFSGEQFLSNHTLEATPRVGARHAPSRLPPTCRRQRNKTFLIGTEGFAALGVLTPDYIVPNGFFAVEGGVINFAGVDIWEYQALPADPTQSYNRDNVLGTNSPRNFAGQTTVLTGFAGAATSAAATARGGSAQLPGHVVAVPRGKRVGLGRVTSRTRATSSSRRGLPTTPTAAGCGSSLPRLAKTTANRFHRCPVPHDGACVQCRSVRFGVGGGHTRRTATFTFTDADNGTFEYSVGTVTQSKPITRQVYASPVSACAAGTMAGTRQSYQDMWWRARPEANRLGRELNHQGDILFATWFTYEAAGKGLWLVIPEARLTTPGTYTGAIYTTTGPALQRGDLEQGPGQGDGDRHGDLHVHGWQLRHLRLYRRQRVAEQGHRAAGVLDAPHGLPLGASP
jgi:hypothetical protein